MEGNIIAVNVPNAVSIIFMAALGALAYNAIKKAMRGPGLASLAPQQAIVPGMAA